ncbi:serine/threonine-protein kinase [Rhodopirellula sp. JC639]|uniref:serine/threonine-protein kinase n=1 Tax=Stieleria mannarensis TaxID=2755585 RepID=UPI001602D4E9|nr:serine/threonine-protein kinase [Rhodopirellula sp. JC639]
MMIDCPTETSLRMLLSEGIDSLRDDVGDGLIDHVGQCRSCQQRLEKLASADVSIDHQLETLLGDQHLAWPTTGVSTELNADATGRTEHTRSDRSPTDPADEPTLALTLDNQLGAKAVTAGNKSDQHAFVGEFGDYELLRQIGAGGMGVVFKARQKSANRIVAVKLIRPDQLSLLTSERAETWKKRFRGEAQAAARLDHDHVVTIYDVGEVDGTLFYSMQFIDGPSLASVVQDSPLENRRVAALMANVAGAVDHAHRHGILHRDLKPQNILLRESRVSSSSSAATLSSGATSKPDVAAGDASESRNVEPTAKPSERPYVADFGLAKATDQDIADSTQTGEVMGSPSFMSPEQAQDASRCTQSSDIYSLGATLYFCLTGRPPFRSASAIETLRQVIDEEPVEPRELNRAIDADLQTITLKSLSKEPAKRYASAADMADDLNRYLRGEPILARPVSRVERSIRWCRRNPVVAALASGIAMLLFLVATISLLSSIRLRQHVQREIQARKEAEEFFSISLDVIHEMVTSYASDSLEHVPQMQTARRELLHRALSFYERLSLSRPTNPQLWNQYARTRYRIALLHSLLGETQQAQLAFRDAIAVLDSLIEASPLDIDLKVQWARSHAMLGETLRITDPESARMHLDRGLSLQTKLHQRFPENTEYKLERSRTLNNLGLLLTQTGEFPRAEDDFHRAIGLLQQLVDAPSVPSEDRSRILADLARSQINLGVLLRKIPGRVVGARESYERAIENLKQSLALESDHRDHQFRLAVAEVDLGNLLLTETDGENEAALEYATDAAQRFRELFDEFPGVPNYLYESANAGNSVAGSLAMLGRRQESMSEFQNAVGRLERMTDKFPEFAETEARFHSLRGRLLGGIGYLHSQNGDWDTAKQFVDQAIVSQRAALRRQPRNPEIQDFLDQHLAFEKSVSERLND